MQIHVIYNQVKSPRCERWLVQPVRIHSVYNRHKRHSHTRERPGRPDIYNRRGARRRDDGAAVERDVDRAAQERDAREQTMPLAGHARVTQLTQAQIAQRDN